MSVFFRWIDVELPAGRAELGRDKILFHPDSLSLFLCTVLEAGAVPYFFPIQIGITPHGITLLFRQVQPSSGNLIFNGSESIQQLSVESTCSLEINSFYSLSFINTCTRRNA